jgi:hypothetical protein
MLTVTLSHASNPDIDGGYWSEPIDAKKKQIIPVLSFGDASEKCREFIVRNDLGGGNWIGGKVFDGKKHVANISFNGRVWGLDGIEIK